MKSKKRLLEFNNDADKYELYLNGDEIILDNGLKKHIAAQHITSSNIKVSYKKYKIFIRWYNVEEGTEEFRSTFIKKIKENSTIKNKITKNKNSIYF